MTWTQATLATSARALRELLTTLELRGSTGDPECWSIGLRTNRMRALARVGVLLVTETSALRRGHVLKRGAVPVARGYYGAPLQRWANLYVFEVQTRPKVRAPAPPPAGAFFWQVTEVTRLDGTVERADGQTRPPDLDKVFG